MKVKLTILFLLTSLSIAQTGVSRGYYPDGTPRYEVSYINDILDGPSYWYFPNGNLRSEKHYSKGVLNGIVREFFDNGLLKEEYTVEYGVKEGNYRSYYPNGALKEILVYSKGVLVKSNRFEFDPGFIPLPEAYLAGNRQQNLIERKKQELICDVEICPVPLGGLKLIQENLVYPEHALLYGLEGVVTLIALVNEKGDVVSSKIIKGLGLGCDEAAQQAVAKTKFIPGQDKGKIVESSVTLNIEFRIFDRNLIAANGNGQPTQQIKAENKDRAGAFSIECDFEICPAPIGGFDEIKKNLEIPSIAKRLKISGNIVIEALIDQHGIVLNTKPIKKIGYGCDDAVESALMKTRFKPAESKGEAVPAVVRINFPFQL